MDSHFFHGKWEPALALIPFLFFRMIAGMATTPIGPLIVVQRGGAVFAKSNFQWTLAEAACAFAFLKLLGPTGLAWSYALVVWFGLWLLLVSLRQKTGSLAKERVNARVLRPSCSVHCGDSGGDSDFKGVWLANFKHVPCSIRRWGARRVFLCG